VLHKATYLRGFHLVARDGEIGHVDELLFDETTWTIRYLVVDTSNWIGGRSVLIAPSVVERVDSPNRKVHVALTREAIKGCPEVDSAPIEVIETTPVMWIM
jgi:hypothetical protein